MMIVINVEKTGKQGAFIVNTIKIVLSNYKVVGLFIFYWNIEKFKTAFAYILKIFFPISILTSKNSS